MKTRGRSQRGNTLVEGALCFTAFIFITFGVMEFAMAIYAYNFCAYAAQDGARWASARGSNYIPTPATPANVQTYVLNQAVAISGVSVNTTFQPDNKPGSTVQVTVSYTVIPLTGVTLHSNLQLSSTAIMSITN